MIPVNELQVLLAVVIWLPLACGLHVAQLRVEGVRASLWDTTSFPVFGALTMIMAGNLRSSFRAALIAAGMTVAWTATAVAVSTLRRSRGVRGRSLKDYDAAVRMKILALVALESVAFLGCVYLAGLGGRLWN